MNSDLTAQGFDLSRVFLVVLFLMSDLMFGFQTIVLHIDLYEMNLNDMFLCRMSLLNHCKLTAFTLTDLSFTVTACS